MASQAEKDAQIQKEIAAEIKAEDEEEEKKRNPLPFAPGHSLIAREGSGYCACGFGEKDPKSADELFDHFKNIMAMVGRENFKIVPSFDYNSPEVKELRLKKSQDITAKVEIERERRAKDAEEKKEVGRMVYVFRCHLLDPTCTHG